MNTLNAELLEVKPVSTVLIVAEDDSWVMSNEEADRLADEARGYEMVESGCYAW